MKNLNFRAWHKENERMYVVDGIMHYDQGTQIIVNADISLNLDEVILMQSTGQKGRWDIEIFDGDIFEYDILNGAYIHEGKGIVKYDYEEGCWKFILKEQITNNKPDSDKINEFSYMSLNEIYYPHLEIIGNVYEQPELLGGGV